MLFAAVLTVHSHCFSPSPAFSFALTWHVQEFKGLYTDLQATQGRIPDEDPRDHQHTWALNLVFSAEIDDFTEAVIDEISARIGMDPDRFVVNKTTTGGTAVLIGSGGKRVPCVELELEIVGAE